MLSLPSQSSKSPKSWSFTEALKSVEVSTINHLYSRVRTRPRTLQTGAENGAISQPVCGWGQVSLLDYFALQRNLLHSGENGPHLPSLISSSSLQRKPRFEEPLYSLSLSLSLSSSDSVAHNISWLGEDNSCSFSTSQFYKYLSLLEGESQTGLRKLREKSFKAKLWSTRVCVLKAGVTQWPGDRL